jgi:hypothetical protein
MSDSLQAATVATAYRPGCSKDPRKKKGDEDNDEDDYDLQQ